MEETKGFGGVDISDQLERKEKGTFEEQLIRELQNIGKSITLLAIVIAAVALWFFLSRP